MNCPHCHRQLDRWLKDLQAGRCYVRENVAIEIVHHDRGDIEHRRAKNLVVTAGLNLLRDLLDQTQGPITHFATGTSNTAAAAGQTALVAEVYRQVVSQRDKSSAEIIHRCFIPTTAANGNTLREGALFNAASAGTMFSRVTHDDIVKTSSVSVTYTWTHTLATV